MRPGKIVKINPAFLGRSEFIDFGDSYFTVVTNPKMVMTAEGWHEILVVDIMDSAGRVLPNVAIAMLEEIF